MDLSRKESYYRYESTKSSSCIRIPGRPVGVARPAIHGPDRSDLSQAPVKPVCSTCANFGRQQVQRDLSDFRLDGFEYISLMHRLHAIVELDFLEALQSHFTSIAAGLSILKTVKIAKIVVDFVLTFSCIWILL